MCVQADYYYNTRELIKAINLLAYYLATALRNDALLMCTWPLRARRWPQKTEHDALRRLIVFRLLSTVADYQGGGVRSKGTVLT